MAIGLGERLAGAGQIQSAFREEQMRVREARERTQQLRDAQRMRQAREAAARNLPQFGAGAVVPSMAGLSVSGLAPVAGTQAPAQRQPAPPAPTPQQVGLAVAPQIPSAGAPDAALAAIDYADTMIVPGQEEPATGGFRTRGSRKFGAPPARTRSVVEQELQQAQSRLAASRNVRGPARARILNNAQAEVERLQTELGRMPAQLGAIAPAAAPAAPAAAPATPAAAPKQQKAQEELVQAAQSVPMGEGPAPQKLADTVAAATSGVMYGRGAEDFDPQAASVATQQALELRQTILAQYNALRQYGFGFRAAELIPQIQAIDLGLYKAQGEQGVYEGITTGNYSKAVTVLSQMQGIPHQVLDRGDGTYDLYVNGRVSETAQTPAALADYFRYQIDQGYRARKAEIASAEYQQQAKINEIVAKSVMDAQGNLQVALLNAQAEIAKEQIKGAKPELTLDTANGVVYVRIGDQVSIVNPRGQVMEIAGEEVEMPTTTRVPGFGG